MESYGLHTGFSSSSSSEFKTEYLPFEDKTGLKVMSHVYVCVCVCACMCVRACMRGVCVCVCVHTCLCV